MAAVVLLGDDRRRRLGAQLLERTQQELQPGRRTNSTRDWRPKNNGDFAAAKIHYDAAAQLAERYSQNAWGHLTRLRSFRELGNLLERQAKSARVAQESRGNQSSSPGKNPNWPNATNGRESKPTPCSRPPIASGSGCCSAKGKSWFRSSRTCRKRSRRSTCSRTKTGRSSIPP